MDTEFSNYFSVSIYAVTRRITVTENASLFCTCKKNFLFYTETQCWEFKKEKPGAIGRLPWTS